MAQQPIETRTVLRRLRCPNRIHGSWFGDWRVCWLGGWGKHRLYYVVMVYRVQPTR